jgi:hypothetical protein
MDKIVHNNVTVWLLKSVRKFTPKRFYGIGSSWCQCYKTFFPSPLTMQKDRLDHFDSDKARAYWSGATFIWSTLRVSRTIRKGSPGTNNLTYFVQWKIKRFYNIDFVDLFIKTWTTRLYQNDVTSCDKKIWIFTKRPSLLLANIYTRIY